MSVFINPALHLAKGLENRCFRLRGHFLTSRYWEPTGTPVRDAILQTHRVEASPAKQLNCLNGEDAIRATAVNHDLAVTREVGKPTVKLIHGYGKRSGNVPCPILLRWPDIEHRDLAASHPPEQSVAVNGLHRTALLQKLPRRTLHLSKTRFSKPSQRAEEVTHHLVSEAVSHENSSASTSRALRST